MTKEQRAKVIAAGLFVLGLPLLAVLKVWERVTRKSRESSLEDADEALSGHPLIWEAHQDARVRPQCNGGAGQPWPPLTPEQIQAADYWGKAGRYDPVLTEYQRMVGRLHQEDQPVPGVARMPLEHHAAQHRERTLTRYRLTFCRCPEPQPVPGVDGFGYCRTCDNALTLDP